MREKAHGTAVSAGLPRQHDPLCQQDRAVQAFRQDLAVLGAETDGVFRRDGAFVGEPPDAERFGNAADEAVGKRWCGKRDEDQPAGFGELEMPPDCDWVLVGRSALKGRKTSDVAAELRWMCGRF